MHRFCFFWIGCWLLASVAQAQFLPEDDPLKRPLGWQELQSAPNSKQSWETYLGKKWEDLTYKESIQVKLLRQRLQLRQQQAQAKANQAFASNKTETRAVKVSPEETSKTDASPPQKTALPEKTSPTRKENPALPPEKDPAFAEALRQQKIKSYIEELEEIHLAESTEMEELFEAPFENFLLIEEYYQEAFAEYGAVYTAYADKYPRGGYSEMRWLEEQRLRLKRVRLQTLNQVKRDFLRAQVSNQ
ncbi:MAG: hypothetical protein ACFCUI_02725 [Bernardetiaceae bacterium]